MPIATVKASSVGIAISSGSVSFGVIQFNGDMVVLALVGLIASIIAYAYDYHHAEIKETRKAMVTSVMLYTLFGMFALPSGFMAVKNHYTDDFMTCMLGGVFSSWAIVAVTKALKVRLQKEIMERKL